MFGPIQRVVKRRAVAYAERPIDARYLPPNCRCGTMMCDGRVICYPCESVAPDMNHPVNRCLCAPGEFGGRGGPHCPKPVGLAAGDDTASSTTPAPSPSFGAALGIGVAEGLANAIVLGVSSIALGAIVGAVLSPVVSSDGAPHYMKGAAVGGVVGLLGASAASLLKG